MEKTGVSVQTFLFIYFSEFKDDIEGFQVKWF